MTIMLRLMRLRLVAGFLAAGLVSLTAASAWAFSQQNVWSGGSGASLATDPDSRYTDPDSQTSAKGYQPLGANGPTLQFGVHQNEFTPFGLRDGDNTSTPDPYFQPPPRGD
jgi:hypothetical protein